MANASSQKQNKKKLRKKKDRKGWPAVGFYLFGVASTVFISGLTLAVTLAYQTFWEDQQNDLTLKVTGWPYAQGASGCGEDILIAAAPGTPEPIYDGYAWDVDRTELIAVDGAGAYGQGRLHVFASVDGDRQVTIINVTTEAEAIDNVTPWAHDLLGTCPPVAGDKFFVDLEDNQIEYGADARLEDTTAPQNSFRISVTPEEPVNLDMVVETCHRSFQFFIVVEYVVAGSEPETKKIGPYRLFGLTRAVSAAVGAPIVGRVYREGEEQPVGPFQDPPSCPELPAISLG